MLRPMGMCRMQPGQALYRHRVYLMELQKGRGEPRESKH